MNKFWEAFPRRAAGSAPVDTKLNKASQQELEAVLVGPSENQPLRMHQDEQEQIRPTRASLDDNHDEGTCFQGQASFSSANEAQKHSELLPQQPPQRHTFSSIYRQMFGNSFAKKFTLTFLWILACHYIFWMVFPMRNDSPSPPSSTSSTSSSPWPTLAKFPPQLDQPLQSSPPSSSSPPHHVVLDTHDPKPTKSLPKLPKRPKRIPRPMTLYNETLIDNYHWMHQYDQDPDVAAYIKAEMEYTKAWVAQSGIQSLQEQIESEMQQIRQATSEQSYLRDELLLEEATSLEETGDISDDPETIGGDIKPVRLEGTQFWDLDRWRYWLDESEGDYGTYRRRPIPLNGYEQAMERKRSEYMASAFGSSSQAVLKSVPATQEDLFAQSGVIGGCSEGNGGGSVVKGSVEKVLNVDRLARQEARSGGQFTFGSLEIQPLYTLLKRDVEAGVDGEQEGEEGEEGNQVKGPLPPAYIAYTFDNSGDERYHIRISTLRTKQKDDLHTTKDKSEQEQEFFANPVDINGAGPETRWVKLGRSLYLYYTVLDQKGLPREVWRVKVESRDAHGKIIYGAGSTGEDISGGENMLQPEKVMRDDDEKNVLSISLTNDHRFLLIESKDQSTSRTYFLNIDSPSRGWNLVRQAEENIMYNVEHHSGFFYLRTNHGGSTNFKVLRIPVSYFNQTSSDMEIDTLDDAVDDAATNRIAPEIDHSTRTARSEFLSDEKDQVVIAHDPEEYLERFETFVEHFVAWVWRGGLQEIRIFLAPRPGEDLPPSALPLPEQERLRPYNPEFKVATVMPGNIRDEEQRLMRNFYSTKFRFSNCSFIHPWALYEYDMHTLTPLRAMDFIGDGDTVRQATRMVCQDPFPLGVNYGEKKRKNGREDADGGRDGLPKMPGGYPTPPESDSMNDGDLLLKLKDPRKEQEKEMAKFKEVRLMVPSSRSSAKAMIPVSVVYYDFPEHNFPRPAFVKAYGAYGTMTSPTFDPTLVLPLLHRGLMYVQVHPRGDGVMGPSWYRDGKLEAKMNTFLDVEDVLLYLRDSGMVYKEGVVIEGRSAGGLVSGWMANRWGEAPGSPPPSSSPDLQSLRPRIGDPATRQISIVREMVKVVLGQVPFLDVIGDMIDPDVPWVEYEWSEWGSPLKSQEIFEVMKRYSPYDRIRSQPYPAMMVMGGMADSRVSFAEPLKFVAKLRSEDGKTNDCQPFEKDEQEGQEEEISTGAETRPLKKKPKKKRDMCSGKNDTPLLLQIEEGGHFSGNASLWMAFALHHLGAEKVVTQPKSEIVDPHF